MLRGVLARASSAMLRRLWRLSVAGSASIKNASAAAAAALLLASLAGGCTRIELENKAEAYDAAIAEANNESVLLNAVRASQRMPMSFIGLGEVQASPNVSATASSNFNFERVTGLTNWSATPASEVRGGFSQFTMTNLNQGKFMDGLRKPVDPKLIRFFLNLSWPRELVEMIAIQAFTVNHQQYLSITRRALHKCGTQSDLRTKEICDALYKSKVMLEEAACHPYDSTELLNTGRDACGMAKFQLFLRSLRLLNLEGRIPFKSRSAQGMLYYLGELIAAQNYSIKPYMPMTLVGTAEGRILVPFFVVRRGVALPGEAAVHVYHRGEPFFIPRPALGAEDEARSLQVLDFVTQVITAQTSGSDIPKSSIIGVLAGR